MVLDSRSQVTLISKCIIIIMYLEVYTIDHGRCNSRLVYKSQCLGFYDPKFYPKIGRYYETPTK